MGVCGCGGGGGGGGVTFVKWEGINSNAIDDFKCWVNFFKVDL